MNAVGPRAIQAIWLVLPLSVGPALAGALDDASGPVQAVGSGGLWIGWVAVLAAALVPRASSLTAVRMAAPAAMAAVVAAAGRGPAGTDDAVAIAAGVAVIAAAWWAVTADAFVDGSSYGAERRFSLRTPPSLLLGPVPVAWMLAVVAPATASLLLAAKAWLPGVLVAAVSVPGVLLGVPALHRLSRRWLVLVPAGLVVHDHISLPDPILLRRSSLRGIGPSAVGRDADEAGTLDLTLGALGLVVALILGEPTDVPAVSGVGRSRQVTTASATRVLVSPSRPGAFLSAAADRRLPIGG